MNILMLAPHPFYQPRGTPIDADLVLRVLSERGDHIDLITFPEGSDVHYPNVTTYRTPALKIVQGIRPGFSIKKVICDVFLLFKAFRLAKNNHYDIIHAGEEAVFIALLLNRLLGIPYVYDMDSSLVGQLTDKYPKIKWFKKVLQGFEGVAVRNAKAVIPVCQALANDIEHYGPSKVVVIPDISLLNYQRKGA
ncbi:MAG: glycosyltransferase family 4 protein [Cyanobacteria bacterium J06634_6]